MGRRNRKRGFFHNKKHQNGSENSGDTEKVQDRRPYSNIIRENEAFIKYYSTQNICGDQWDEFLEKIKSDLPSTFRITASKGEAKLLLDVVENQFIQKCDQEQRNDFFPLPWYPNRLAWQLGLTRKDIRRSEANYRLHNFLISETKNGTISRQETVSMIPPLVLDIKSHHKILDMCAAPGSKTAQLIELLHNSDEKTQPKGFVIANDIDNSRCYMLVHQAKRLNSPCIAITNHNSQFMPNLFSTNNPSGKREKIEFDRILCDVPCSGDGTLRKNPDIWLKWTPANGLNQHGIQFRIARRGAELLTIGGKMVYSTCSLNPIENEAVIHRLLVHCNGNLKLVDASHLVPGLKYAPGMEKWKVSSRHCEFYDTFDEVDEKWNTTIVKSMFPPAEEDREKFDLKKCMRIFPHYQDTGAFFVAVLEKTGPIYHKKEKIDSVEEKQTENQAQNTEDLPKSEDEVENTSEPEEQPAKKQKLSRKNKAKGYKEDPFVFFKPDEDVWSDIKGYYNVSDDFDVQCLLTRCLTGKKKNIYYCSPAVRDIVANNQENVKFINTGVKTFVRSDNRHMTCAFRLAHEGLESIIDHIKGRIVQIPKDDLLQLLANTDPLKSPEITSLSQGVQDQVKDLSPGSCVLHYIDPETTENPFEIYMSGWRGTSSLRCYITDFNAEHYLRLLGGDISKYDTNKFKKNEEDKEVEEETEDQEVKMEIKEGPMDHEEKTEVKQETMDHKVKMEVKQETLDQDVKLEVKEEIKSEKN